MFESLSDRLNATFTRLGSKGRLDEADIDDAMKEVRRALLEADVNFKVVKSFVERVRERAVGQEVMRSLTPAQQVVAIVHEQLIELLGEAAKKSGQFAELTIALVHSSLALSRKKERLRSAKQEASPIAWHHRSKTIPPDPRCWSPSCRAPSNPRNRHPRPSARSCCAPGTLKSPRPPGR